MAYISYDNITTNSAEITVTGLQVVKYKRIFYFYLDDDYKGSRSLAAESENDVYFTFRNLSAGTSYNIKVSVFKVVSGQDDEWLTNIEDSFQTEEIPVLLWTWDDCQTIEGDVGEASDVETMSAYNAITRKMETTEFSYKVWNDLCAKTREVRRAKGVSIEWKTHEQGYNFPSYFDTLMSNDDKILTAERFNSLRINIGSMTVLAGIPFPVVTGGEVVGRYFTILTEGINDVIREL